MWFIYCIFNIKDGDKIFIGIISEKYWECFCKIFGWVDWLEDECLSINGDWIDERSWFMLELEY